MARCRTCAREVLWALTEHGKAIPIDPDPRPDGNIVLRSVGGVDQRIAHVLAAAEVAPGAPRYVSHFATCPDSALHRRRRAAA